MVKEGSKRTQFKGDGKGIRHGSKAMGAKFPEPYLSQLEEMPDRSEFIREAVTQKLQQINSYAISQQQGKTDEEIVAEIETRFKNLGWCDKADIQWLIEKAKFKLKMLD